VREVRKHSLAVAVQVALEKQALKPGFHFRGSRVAETRHFQAASQLNSTCAQPHLAKLNGAKSTGGAAPVARSAMMLPISGPILKPCPLNPAPTARVGNSRVCQIGYMGTILAVTTRVVTSRVSDRLHGNRTGCHQLNHFFIAK
jgi:hypothetical protein